MTLSSTKKVTASKFVFRRQSTFSELLVLSVDEFKLGRSDLILINPAVKVNGEEGTPQSNSVQRL